jgi:iron(III) transport system permease protein
MLKFQAINFWGSIPYLILALFILPVIIIISSLFGEWSENWSHIYNFVLFDYVSNSILLVMGVTVLVFIIGVGSAWIITNYRFFGKNTLEWALILPLSVPPYILAYTFTGLFDTYGTANNFLRDLFNLQSDYAFFPNIRNIYGAIIVFSFTLYPYVYLVSRSAFLNQSQAMIEAARLLGLNKIQVFFKLAVPIIRPAIIGGIMLVSMETLSDFGAVDHFAIQTFTTGIFRTWYGMYDINTAMQLASMLLLFVGLFLILERYSRNNAIYTSKSSTFRPIKLTKLQGHRGGLAFLICFLPVFIGFILPILELSFWAFERNLNFFDYKFLSTTQNTIILAITAGILCSIFALVVNYSIRFNKDNFSKHSGSLLSLGYAVPGLILAVGIVQLFTWLDATVFVTSEIVLTGSLIGLIFAYIIKSYALANSSIESGYERISSSIDDSARVLKSTGFDMLKRIHFPLLKTSFLTSTLLVISEVTKELPATLILRPFNFDTLAVSTYIYAAEERMMQASAPAIAIVMVGLIPIIILTKMIRTSRPGKRDYE